MSKIALFLQGLAIVVVIAVGFMIAGFALYGCPKNSTGPSPVLPIDADGTLAPPSFEQTVCRQIANAGCAWGSHPGCPAALAANTLDDAGDYLTPWAACIYRSRGLGNCGVPCGDP